DVAIFRGCPWRSLCVASRRRKEGRSVQDRSPSACPDQAGSDILTGLGVCAATRLSRNNRKAAHSLKSQRHRAMNAEVLGQELCCELPRQAFELRQSCGFNDQARNIGLAAPDIGLRVPYRLDVEGARHGRKYGRSVVFRQG